MRAAQEDSGLLRAFGLSLCCLKSWQKWVTTENLLETSIDPKRTLYKLFMHIYIYTHFSMTQRVVILAVRVDVSSFASSNRSIQTLSVNNERLQGELEDLSSFVYCQFGSSHRNSQFHARCGLNK